MNRRALLAALGTGATALAGCVGTPGNATPASTVDSTPTDERPTTRDPTTRGTPAATVERLSVGETFEGDGRRVTVREVRARPSIARSVLPHVSVFDRPGRQYLVARITVVDGSGATLTGRDRYRALRIDLGVELDGSPAATAHPALVHPPERSASEFGFPVPNDVTPEAGAVTLAVDGGRVAWALGSETLDALARPATFEIRGFEVPDAVERGSSFDATATVANAGERDARFLADFGSAVLSETREVSFEVPAGETVTHTETVHPTYLDGEDEVPIVLDWGSPDDWRIERTAAVEG